jgi:hypothetical protein
MWQSRRSSMRMASGEAGVPVLNCGASKEPHGRAGLLRCRVHPVLPEASIFERETSSCHDCILIHSVFPFKDDSLISFTLTEYSRYWTDLDVSCMACKWQRWSTVRKRDEKFQVCHVRIAPTKCPPSYFFWLAIGAPAPVCGGHITGRGRVCQFCNLRASCGRLTPAQVSQPEVSPPTFP